MQPLKYGREMQGCLFFYCQNNFERHVTLRLYLHMALLEFFLVTGCFSHQ